MKIVLLNGPPRSGKDTAARILHQRKGFYVTKFAKYLKERTHLLYGHNYPHDYFEDFKDEPLDIFFGLTPRQAYINVSELYFKRVHGQYFFGERVVEDLKRKMPKCVAISDCGFLDEIVPVVQAFGSENIMLIRFSSEGCSYKHDSRSPVDLGPQIHTVSLINHKDKYFGDAVIDTVDKWIAQRMLEENS